MGAIKINLNTNYMPIKIYLNSFDTLIRPILTYGCEIWGIDLLHNKRNFKENINNDNSKPELLHMKFLKRLLGVNSKASNIGTRSEFGRHPIIAYIIQQIIRYYVRLEAMPNTRLLKQIYNCTKNKPFSTAKVANHIATLCNFQFNKYNLETQKDYKKCLKQFNNHWNFFLENDWYATLNNPRGPTGQKNKLRFYAKIKKTFCLENYLIIVKNPEYRKYTAQLRISAHQLEIEQGRHKRKTTTENNVEKKVPIPENERICNYCSTHSIENEIHFLLKCSFYSDERKDFLDSFNYDMSTVDPDSLVTELFNRRDSECVLKFARYISTLIEKRKKETMNI